MTTAKTLLIALALLASNLLGQSATHYVATSSTGTNYKILIGDIGSTGTQSENTVLTISAGGSNSKLLNIDRNHAEAFIDEAHTSSYHDYRIVDLTNETSAAYRRNFSTSVQNSTYPEQYSMLFSISSTEFGVFYVLDRTSGGTHYADYYFDVVAKSNGSVVYSTLFESQAGDSTYAPLYGKALGKCSAANDKIFVVLSSAAYQAVYDTKFFEFDYDGNSAPSLAHSGTIFSSPWLGLGNSIARNYDIDIVTNGSTDLVYFAMGLDYQSQIYRCGAVVTSGAQGAAIQAYPDAAIVDGAGLHKYRYHEGLDILSLSGGDSVSGGGLFASALSYWSSGAHPQMTTNQIVLESAWSGNSRLSSLMTDALSGGRVLHSTDEYNNQSSVSAITDLHDIQRHFENGDLLVAVFGSGSTREIGLIVPTNGNFTAVSGSQHNITSVKTFVK